MIEHIWSVVCSRSITDQTTNNVTLVEVIERLAAPLLPQAQGIAPIQMFLVTLWTRSVLGEPKQGRARMRLLAPDQEQIGDSVTYQVDLTSFARLRNTIAIGGFPFRGGGYHFFVVEREDDAGIWQPVARIPVEVALETPAAQAPAFDSPATGQPN